MRATAAVSWVLLAGAGFALGQETTPPRRIFHLDSYAKGYGISDDTAAGIRSVLADRPVTLSTFFLDTKRRATEAELRESVARARTAIEEFKPDVLIASDDAAVKYVVSPFYKDGPFPVVFCGVNWSADPYGLPTANVTGMVEVVPVLETIELARKYFPGISRLGVLSEDSLSEQNNKLLLQPKYKALGLDVTYVTVKDYAGWKREFERLQGLVDIVYLPTNGAITDWNATDARAFVKAQTRKPVIASDDFMMPYAVFGLTKSQVEQGEWAARTALEILAGRKPSQIAVVRNRRRIAYVNATLAAAIHFVPGPELEGARPVE